MQARNYKTSLWNMGYVACSSAFECPRIYRTSMYVCEETSIVLASVPGLPRCAIYCARLIVQRRETLKTGKAWDETSRAHRRWVDAGSRAPRCLDRKYVYTHELSFWLTATCSSAVKANTYAYRTCVRRSRVYTFIR